MRCDHRRNRSVMRLDMQFQSLLGFLMRCDLPVVPSPTMGTKFQSLLGFLMRCDLTSFAITHPFIV